jgi:serine/threonine protein kinase
MGTLTAVLQHRNAAQSATTPAEPATGEGQRPFSEWLDELSDGECDRETLIRGVHSAIDSNPDAGFELLALVDQYYRRHLIEEEDFRGLNLRVQSIVMGGVRTAEVVPLTQPCEPDEQPESEAQPVSVAPPAATAAAAAAPRPAAAPPRRTIAVNDVLRNRYRVQGILGRGGMGTVYAAIDQYRLNNDPGDQRIALKVLHAEVIQRPGLLAQLRGEFQTLQSLSHPNIVRVHEFDQDGDLTFFTMERLDGMSLSRMMAEQKSVALQRPYALAMIRQISTAVAYAHSRGIVHGDLNPANIFVTESGEIRILDFGAAYRLSAVPFIPDMDGDSRTNVATPTFASCELLEGKQPLASDDVYALGCISYVLLTGEHPFRCRNALAARKARQEPRRPSGLSHQQWRMLKAALSFERKNRPPDAQIWLDKFPLPPTPAQLPPLAVLMAETPTRRPIGPWVTCTLIALIAGALWWAQDQYHLASLMGTGQPTATRGSLAPAAPTPPVQPPTRALTHTAPAIVTAAPPVAASQTTQSPVTSRAPKAARAAAQSAAPVEAQIDMGARTVDVSPLQSVASVPVQRRHNYRRGISFTWSTEAGTARPGLDFVPVTSRTEYMAAGEPETHLLIPIVADPRRKTDRTFYVVINSAEDGATLGSRNLTMVTIPAAN